MDCANLNTQTSVGMYKTKLKYTVTPAIIEITTSAQCARTNAHAYSRA